jgi:murein DD-endopeptidase MepM/ murein hydrolase activator NlpD
LTYGLLAAGNLLVSRAARTVRKYPKQITATIATFLLCTGGGALAIASLGPDAADLPVRQVLEAIGTPAVSAQMDAVDAYDFTLFRTEFTRSSDTAETLLRRLGIVDSVAAAFIRSNVEARAALLGRAGRSVSAEATHENQLKKLSARWIPDGNGSFQRFVVELTPQGLVTRTEVDALTPSSRLASGVVRSSLFAATDDAAIPDAVASQLVDIFSGDIDVRALRKGDRFAVVYETQEADGQSMRTGRVLSAEFESNGQLHQAVWFQEPNQKGSYYRPNGDNLRRAYLTSPVAFSRISSGFAMRFHPILNNWRQHNGIDFAAPTGTPVRAVGDGVVEFAGIQNGYGSIIILKHRNSQETVYAHLSRIDVKVGQSVNQSQFIGAVGMTGWATGPHLHFEFRVNGAYEDPATIAQQDGGVPLALASRPAFARLAASSRTELAAAFSVIQASAD